ncbi:Leucine rich repeat-containing protein [Entamoeba marina]
MDTSESKTSSNNDFISLFKKELTTFKSSIKNSSSKEYINLNPATVLLFNGLTNPSYGKMDKLQSEFNSIKGVTVEGNNETVDGSDNDEKTHLPLSFLEFCNIEKLRFLNLQYEIDVNKYGTPSILQELEVIGVLIDDLKLFLINDNEIVWKSLRKLSIKKAKIRSIEDGLFTEDFFPQLETLDLSDNCIDALENIGERPLDELILNNNNISNIRITVVGSISKLELGDNKISTIIPLSTFYGLEHLNLAGNQIRSHNEFDKVFSKMFNLKSIVLSGNPLTTDENFKINVFAAMPIVKSGFSSTVFFNGQRMTSEEQQKTHMKLSASNADMLMGEWNEEFEEKQVNTKASKEKEIEKRRRREMKANARLEKRNRVEKELNVSNFYRQHLSSTRKKGFEHALERTRAEEYLQTMRDIISKSRIKQTLEKDIFSSSSSSDSEDDVRTVNDAGEEIAIAEVKIDINKWSEQMVFDKQYPLVCAKVNEAKQKAFNIKFFFGEESTKSKKAVIEIPLSKPHFDSYLSNIFDIMIKYQSTFIQNDKMKLRRWNNELTRKEQEYQQLEEEKKKTITLKTVKREMSDGNLVKRIDEISLRQKNKFVSSRGDQVRLLSQTDKIMQRAAIDKIASTHVSPVRFAHTRSDKFQPPAVKDVKASIQEHIDNVTQCPSANKKFSRSRNAVADEAQKSLRRIIESAPQYNGKAITQKIQKNHGLSHRPSSLVGYARLLEDQNDYVFSTKPRKDSLLPNFFGGVEETKNPDPSVFELLQKTFKVTAQRRRTDIDDIENLKKTKSSIWSKIRFGSKKRE